MSKQITPTDKQRSDAKKVAERLGVNDLYMNKDGQYFNTSGQGRNRAMNSVKGNEDHICELKDLRSGSKTVKADNTTDDKGGGGSGTSKLTPQQEADKKAADDLKSARAEYKSKVGKSAGNQWDLKTIKSKMKAALKEIAEAEANKPTEESSIEEIRTWLTENKIDFADEAEKPELLNLVDAGE